METNVKLQNTNVNVSLIGRFQLKVKADPKRFRLTNINSFVPFGGDINSRLRFKNISGEVDTLLIDRVVTTFYPDEKIVDSHNVKTLIQHPDVFIEGMNPKDWEVLVQGRIKKANPKFVLVNIDKVESIEFDKEAELLEVRAMLFSKKNPISKDKLVWMCSKFNLPYRSKINDKDRLRQDLIKRLDKFVKSSDENIEKFSKAFSDIKNTEYYYYINELMESGIIVEFSGIYKIGETPVGATYDHIIEWYESNHEIFNEHKKIVYEKNRNTALA